MNNGNLGRLVLWAFLFGILAIAVNGSPIHIGDDDSSSTYPGKEICTLPIKPTCPTDKLTTKVFIHKCLTALFTIYVTDEPYLERYTLRFTKVCPDKEKVIYITDCFPLLVTEAPITNVFTAQYSYCETQAPQPVEKSQEFSYYVTVPAEVVNKQAILSYNVPIRFVTKTIREAVSAMIPGEVTYDVFSASVTYKIGGAPMITEYQLHFKKLESQAPEEQILSTRLINQNTPVLLPETYTFVYESFETEGPLQTSYVIDYTGYVKVPTSIKEEIITYTEYVTEQPELVELTKIVSFLADIPLFEKELFIDFTIFVTQPMVQVEKEASFTFFETVKPVFEQKVVVITYYSTQAPGIDIITATITEFRTTEPRRARIIFTYDAIISGTTQSAELTVLFTSCITPAFTNVKVSTEYVVYKTLAPETTCVVLTFPVHVTSNLVVDECTQEFTVVGVAPLVPETCHRSYSYQLKQYLGCQKVVIDLTQYVTDKPEITSAICEFTVCVPECIPHIP